MTIASNIEQIAHTSGEAMIEAELRALEIDGKDQDWEAGTTRYTFVDGSVLFVDDVSFEARDPIRVVNEAGLAYIRDQLRLHASAWIGGDPTAEAIDAYAQAVEACSAGETPQFEISAAQSASGRPVVVRLDEDMIDVRPVGEGE